jgi:hypothetical protein
MCVYAGAEAAPRESAIVAEPGAGSWLCVLLHTLCYCCLCLPADPSLQLWENAMVAKPGALGGQHSARLKVTGHPPPQPLHPLGKRRQHAACGATAAAVGFTGAVAVCDLWRDVT